MEYNAWTYFVGSKKEAKDFVNEWNTITNSDSFKVSNNPESKSNKKVFLIEGVVSANVIKETNIENEFVIE
jgi:hypothetical protein